MRTAGTTWITVAVVATLAVAGTSWSDPPDEKSTAKTPSVDEQAQQSMQRGLDWLKDQQKENGSWSNENYPAMTALALWAFTRSDHPDKDDVCEKAASFVAGFAQDDGGIYKPATGGRGSGGLSTYNTAICMIALHTYDRTEYAQQILKARKFLAGRLWTLTGPRH